MDIIRKAEKWASSVWKRNVSRWQNRCQDYNYRQYLVHPAIEEAIGCLNAVKGGLFLDLGCGDGSEMDFITKCLIRQGSFGRFYGFDLQRSLIETAQRKYCERRSIEMIFNHGSLDSLVRKHELYYSMDRVFSTFLLQELPNANDHLFLAMKSMKPYCGGGVFVLLDPAFGQAMLDKGVINVNEDLGETEYWRWAGEYPIVEENGRTFYVPYFHRNLEDYKKMVLENFGSFLYRQFSLSRTVLKKCNREKISPFYDHTGNVYYPQIKEIPSTLIFIVDQPRSMPQIF